MLRNETDDGLIYARCSSFSFAPPRRVLHRVVPQRSGGLVTQCCALCCVRAVLCARAASNVALPSPSASISCPPPPVRTLLNVLRAVCLCVAPCRSELVPAFEQDYWSIAQRLALVLKLDRERHVAAAGALVSYGVLPLMS